MRMACNMFGWLARSKVDVPDYRVTLPWGWWFLYERVAASQSLMTSSAAGSARIKGEQRRAEDERAYAT